MCENAISGGSLKRVAGVVGVANDLEVRLPAINERPDPEIARDAVAAIKTQLPVSSENIKVVATNGWIALEGRVEGVKGVTNSILLEPRAKPAEIKRKIQDAFKRSAELDANRITVEANGSEVTLKGTARSWAERREAQRVAWQAPGVMMVDDRIVVSP
jgi:osmotically-inducible protein OsmY